MNPKILAFLEKERVCVLSGIIPKGGSHSSTVHYSHGVNPLRFFFQTWDESMKVEAVYKIHFKKHPFAEKYKNEHTVVIEFTPTWWRYTDFNTTPETIIDME